MSLNNYFILFFIIFIPFMAVTTFNLKNVITAGEQIDMINSRVDTAIEDATYNLVEVDNNQRLVTNKGSIVENYFQSLYSNFGVLDDAVKQEMLNVYTPILVLIDNDGFYINYCKEISTDTGEVGGAAKTYTYGLAREWTDKIPYTYSKDGVNTTYIYSFYLDGTVSVLDTKNNKVVRGTRQDIDKVFSDSICYSEEVFSYNKKKAIISCIQDQMRYYINEHNYLAKQTGVTYHFSLPVISDSDWTRTVSDVSLFAVFQGYPYGSATNDVYNQYAFGAARISKFNAYYVTVSKTNGVRYYHKSTCDDVEKPEITVTDTDAADNEYGGSSTISADNSGLEMYYTKEDAAKSGAYPCPNCNP